MDVRFTAATPADEPDIRNLPRDAGLPHEDFAGHLTFFLTAKEGNLVVGVIGMEIYGTEALVRLFAVEPHFHSKGIGGGLYEQLENKALAAGVHALYLLTQTAQHFFKKRGYRLIRRNDAPSAIQNTLEFSTLCPSEAECMKKVIRQAH